MGKASRVTSTVSYLLTLSILSQYSVVMYMYSMIVVHGYTRHTKRKLFIFSSCNSATLDYFQSKLTYLYPYQGN